MYINRTLKSLDESQILEQNINFNYLITVITAEPGAGKTELLNNIAITNNSQVLNASSFKFLTNVKQNNLILLDGLDELTKIGIETVKEVLFKIITTSPIGIVLSCRASEWDKRYEKFLSDISPFKIQQFQLLPFTETEQKNFINVRFPEINFDNFIKSTKIYDLNTLLSNPLLLGIFAEAYILNQGNFISKTQAFSDACNKMVSESNPNAPTEHKPNAHNLLQIFNKLSTVLLLSGSNGICTDEFDKNDSYPHLSSILNIDKTDLRYLIDTKLFKPTSNLSLFEPIHRIVSEYCCANYLVNRMKDQTDLLTLKRTLSVLAPNDKTRDDLRGVLGWLCALGNFEIQKEIITLDPYSVIAYGDPSQIPQNLKGLLLKELINLSEQDPYFRNSDRWRDFNIKDFFNEDIVIETNSTLLSDNVPDELKCLILELIQTSSVKEQFTPSLISIIRSSTSSLKSRRYATLAIKNLPRCETEELVKYLIKSSNSDNHALEIACYLIKQVCFSPLRKEIVKDLFIAFNSLYQSNSDERFLSRYFIKDFIVSLDIQTILYLLNELTKELKCICQKEPYECYCRDGISKNVSKLLNQLVKLEPASLISTSIWNWVKNLHFRNNGNINDNDLIKYLNKNLTIKHQIQVLYFTRESTESEEKYRELKYNLGFMHSGIRLTINDYVAITQYAFENKNILLWKLFYICHDPEQDKNIKGIVIELRQTMKNQSQRHPLFLRTWTSLERYWKLKKFDEFSKRNYSYIRKNKRKTNRNQIREIKYFNRNIELILSGQHYGWLRKFSYILQREKFDEFSYLFKDKSIPETSLSNCLDFIRPSLPSLSEVIKNKIKGSSFNILDILASACISIYRKKGDLNCFTNNELELIYYEDDWNWEGITDTEEESIIDEIKTRIFKNKTDYINYAELTIEPFFKVSHKSYVKISWLKEIPPAYKLQEELIFNWLKNYNNIALNDLNTLFDLLINTGDINKSLNIIKIKTEHYLSILNEPNEKLFNHAIFWFVRYFYFVKDNNIKISKFITQNPDDIFNFISKHDGIRSKELSWPNLTANKVYLILNAFIDSWPEVYLPSHWGTGSPPNETAYRFLTDFVWRISDDNPEQTIFYANEMLNDPRFISFKKTLLHLKAKAKGQSIQIAPKADNVLQLLNAESISTVHMLKTVLLEALEELQKWLKGAETDPLDKYHNLNSKTRENTIRNRIVEDLNQFLLKYNLATNIEKYMAKSDRCDITYQSNVDGRENLLVIEVKGQWNKEIFTAPKTQLYDRYSHHPLADLQGIYLVLWFGKDEIIEGKKGHQFNTASELETKIFDQIPDDIQSNISIFTLDLTN